MPVTIRRVRRQLTTGVSSGTFQATHPDITTPDCGIVFTTSANVATGARQPHARWSIGLFEGTSQRSASNSWQNGVATTATHRVQSYSDVSRVVRLGSNSIDGEFEITSIVPGGVECTYRDAYVYDHLVEFLLIEGCTAVDLRSNAQLNGGSANIGFKPDLLIICGTTGGDSPGTVGKASLGVAVRDPGDDSISQWAICWECRDNDSDVIVGTAVANDGCLLRTNQPNSNINAKYILASFDANGYSFTNTGSNLTNVPILALQLPPDAQPLAGTFNLRTTIGLDTIPTPYAAGDNRSELVLLGSQISTNPIGTFLGRGPDSVSFGTIIDDSIDQAVWTFSEQDRATTAQAEGSLRDGSAIELYQGGNATDYRLAAVTDIEDGIDITTSQTSGNADLIGWLAIQGVSAAPSDDVDVALPREELEVTGRVPSVRTTETVASGLPREQLTLTGWAPSVSAKMPIEVGLEREQLTVTARAPAVGVQDSAQVTLPRLNLSVTGRAPSVNIKLPVEVQLPREQLTLTGRAPSVTVPGDNDIALPREQLTLTGRAPSVEVPNDTEITLVRAALDLTARVPLTRTTEEAASTLPRTQLTLTSVAPGVVVEGVANVQLGRAQLTLTGRAPNVSDGEGHTVTLPREQLTLTGRAPTVVADSDTNATLPAARLQSRASAPNTYLAGDKITDLPSARLTARALFVRVRTTGDAPEGGDTGVVSTLGSDVASTPGSPRIG